MKRMLIAVLYAAFLVLTGCTAAQAPKASRVCRVVLEESEAFTPSSAWVETVPSTDAVFRLSVHPGWTLTDVSYPGAAMTTAGDGSYVELTLPAVRYSVMVTVTAVHSDRSIIYDDNCGLAARTEQQASAKHLRVNTAADLFDRDGFTQIGWSTVPDGSTGLISLGSRVTLKEGEHITLYAQWAAWTSAACFTWHQEGSGIALTGCSGAGDVIVIPAAIDGIPVMSIEPAAFENTVCSQVILPSSLRRIASGAFSGCTLQTLVMYDTLQAVHDDAFTGCNSLRTLRIQAGTQPVYSGTYYSTFADKMDRLLTLKDEAKLVLFSGSSTRFGYDSAMLDAAFPDYQVCNMGVFAYTNALPQLLLIADCLRKGDILIDSPELDAAKRQFCTTSKLDAAFYRLIEADYDLLARLDLLELSCVFSAFNEYNAGRSSMSARSYELSAADYDEDGLPVSTPSYNEYGDYCLYRPDADADMPIYGLAVPYTCEAYPVQQYIEPYNAMCQRLMTQGVRVFFTWSPRNRMAVSEESTPEAMAALEAYLADHLTVPMLLPLEESLVSGRLLYGTDNHLSTNGAALHTEHIIQALTAALEVEP